MKSLSPIKIPNILPLPWREGIKGRGKIYVYPHPNPLPSRERGKFFKGSGFIKSS
jgi:hypothetical protein